MFDLIHKMHVVFNSLKGLEAGYTSENHEEMLVKFEGKIYKMSLKELGEGLTSDYIETLKK